MIAAEILDAAYARSAASDAGVDADAEGELLHVLGRSLQSWFSAGARENPAFYGAREAMDPVNGSWPRPPDAEMVFLVETQGGDPVAVVDVRHRWSEAGRASVYELGGRYHPSGHGPSIGSSEPLLFTYARRPVLPATLESTIDPAFPATFHDLLILDVAIHLAVKDERGGELQALRAEREEHAALYTRHLEHATLHVLGRSTGFRSDTPEARP